MEALLANPYLLLGAGCIAVGVPGLLWKNRGTILKAATGLWASIPALRKPAVVATAGDINSDMAALLQVCRCFKNDEASAEALRTLKERFLFVTGDAS